MMGFPIFLQVFDGHGGPDAAAYTKKHATRFLFKDANFPRASEADNNFVESVENSVREAFLLADLALAEDSTVSSSSGTTALTAMVFGRFVTLFFFVFLLCFCFHVSVLELC